MFKSLIDRINTILFDSKDAVLKAVGGLGSVAFIAGFSLLIYLQGFDLPVNAQKALAFWLEVVFGVFIFTFAVKLLYNSERKQFLRANLIEFIMLFLILLNGVFNLFTEASLLQRIYRFFGEGEYFEFYKKVFSLYLLIVLLIEFVRIIESISQINVRPAASFIISFLMLIFIGSGLLMLPSTTVGTDSMSFIDALFTATSATCVTGLIVVDTATYFSFKGHLVILVLMQLGGIGIVSFATFFSGLLRHGVGIKQQSLIQDHLNSDSLASAKDLLRRVVNFTLLIELISFVMIYTSWEDDAIFSSVGEKVFVSFFHAVSAFCNAGFSLFTNGLYNSTVVNSYAIHVIVILTVILGGLGFSTLQDLFSIKKLRDRLNNPWKDWELGTKVAVYMAATLLIFGMVMFYILERNNTLQGMNFMESMITSFFQSGTTRTAGFNTVDIASLTMPTIFIFVFLMFIGASSGSVGGGIKTSTFFIIVQSVIATIRGNKKVVINKLYIPNSTIFRALSTFVFAVVLNLIGVFVLSITEPGARLEQIMFEQVSAFATVGLSMGITPELSMGGKVMIIISMFLGRVGTLTFALALSFRGWKDTARYPRASLMVG
ncbi:TrkH family potassium uptake protein [Mangrovivirga cuniculi]|uniref:ATPase n=1 Tax=Mangrovivirga cuniculi TaxID=2715131 RepID=A0A4D7JRE1_9BACT|nr:potassium transporter TrkG [Mangrovivirga cuniculi]QCK14296.1 ATPase [Mangrovivirga cuniculi]